MFVYRSSRLRGKCTCPSGSACYNRISCDPAHVATNCLHRPNPHSTFAPTIRCLRISGTTRSSGNARRSPFLVSRPLVSNRGRSRAIVHPPSLESLAHPPVRGQAELIRNVRIVNMNLLGYLYTLENFSLRGTFPNVRHLEIDRRCAEGYLQMTGRKREGVVRAVRMYDGEGVHVEIM
jgi:hypothetical protein